MSDAHNGKNHEFHRITFDRNSAQIKYLHQRVPTFKFTVGSEKKNDAIFLSVSLEQVPLTDSDRNISSSITVRPHREE